MEGIQKVMMAVLNNLQENNFWKCFNSWKEHWNSCRVVGGNYSEAGHCTSG
jgi:hypothetical protein